MAVALRSQGSPNASDSTVPLTLDKPAGVQEGDYLVAFIHNQSAGSTDIGSTGWTRVGAPFVANDAGIRVTGFFAKIATGSEPATYSFSRSGTGRAVGFIAAFSGVDTNNPIASTTGWSTFSAPAASLSVAADPASADTYTLELWAANFSAGSSYALSTYTGGLSLLGDAYHPSGTENTSVSRSAVRVWSGVAPSGGVPSHTIAASGSSAHACAALISLNAAPSSPSLTPIVTGHWLQVDNANTSTITINPASNPMGSPLVAGNWMVMVITAAADVTNMPTIPSEWRQIRAHGIVGTVGAATSSLGIWAKIREPGETTYTFTQTTGSNTTSTRLVWGAGGDIPSNWVIGSFTARIDTGTPTTNVASAITTAQPNTLALLLSHERTITTETENQITCTNFTKKYVDLQTSQTLLVATKEMASAGDTGSSTVTYPNPHNQNGMAGIIGIPPAPLAPSGLALKISNGTSLVDARFKVSDGVGSLITPGAYKAIRPGYASVSQMLSQPLFYCAHRGGSRDFPEMSLYAYGQSAIVGYPALELSLARTSDGVWFGLHDASLDRTSLGTGGGSGTTLVASSMTWAQVQAYSILGSTAANNTSQPNRPYMQWDELMSIYYDSHVIFVDPKVAINYRAELLNMMDALPGSTSKFIGKYYGVSGGPTDASGWNYDCHQRGYKTWGYFYDTDSTNYATYAPRWDIIGMNYTAAQSYWNDLAAAAPGKPIMGHICPDAAAVSTAITKGAAGVMVSGIKVNVPPAVV